MADLENKGVDFESVFCSISIKVKFTMFPPSYAIILSDGYDKIQCPVRNHMEVHSVSSPV